MLTVVWTRRIAGLRCLWPQENPLVWGLLIQQMSMQYFAVPDTAHGAGGLAGANPWPCRAGAHILTGLQTTSKTH